MEASALLTRNPDPSDARSTFATITPRGSALVASARHSHHELLQQTFGSALDNRDIADLTRITKRLAASTPTAKPDASTHENQAVT
jgi:DNA-binding MarR family transcriptional regulator